MTLPLRDAWRHPPDAVGSKAIALSRLAAQGLPVPDGLVIPTGAYLSYIGETGLGDRIALELNRKSFEDMRWEEIWDASLRIRNYFLRTPLPERLEGMLSRAIGQHVADRPTVVRSSAPGEDAGGSSFAGLHASFVNVSGTRTILEHVRLVWASLWSDAALLYRRELELEVAHSAMAVIIQELVCGRASGVAFSQHPNNPGHAVVEAVHGLNQGLVDGTVMPDRWILDRPTGQVIRHEPAEREAAIRSDLHGVKLVPLAPDTAARPPLLEAEVLAVYGVAARAEALFGSPQDVEWTLAGPDPVFLQARPVTTLQTAGGQDRRAWYRSLSRTFDNLKHLRDRIQHELIPGMVEDAASLASRDPAASSDDALRNELRHRHEIVQKWRRVYEEDFIPFAHGFRLFGQVYNDRVQPEDPYAFTDLLLATDLASVERNAKLAELGSRIAADPELAARLRAGDEAAADSDFRAAVADFIAAYGNPALALSSPAAGAAAEKPLLNFLLELARRPPRTVPTRADTLESRTRDFLSRFEGNERKHAVELLELARMSYRLRDDDNIYLNAVEGQWLAAVAEAKRRLAAAGVADAATLAPEAAMERFKKPRTPAVQAAPEPERDPAADRGPRPIQLIGQPAGPGLARGKACVIHDPADLFAFKHGDVLVCDALSPTMTFVVPLAAAIVERRGGMLIHGAIIAREYGIPCVTGVPDAARLITTGSEITVDGYLGIVRLTGEWEKGVVDESFLVHT